MEIKYPRRILIVGAPDSGALEVVKDLTGTTPILSSSNSTAGLTHTWHVETTYYTAELPIWLDEIPASDPEAWEAEFLKPEAKEVVEAVGAWVYCFRPPYSESTSSGDGEGTNGQKEREKEIENTLRAIQNVIEEHVGFTTGDVVMLAVAVPRSKHEVRADQDGENAKWEDLCLEFGFEFVDFAGEGVNEFMEKRGTERVREALEANNWSGGGADEEGEGSLGGFGFDAGFDDGDVVGGFSRDEAEMTAELYGMKAALAGDDFEAEEGEDDAGIPTSGQESQVEDLDRLMGRLLAVREQSAELPEAQRKRMAAQAVRDLMNNGAV